MWLSIGSLALGAAVAGQAALLAGIVDRSFARGEPIASLAGLVGLLLAVMAARALLVYSNGRIGLVMAANAKKAMREAAVRRLVHLPASSSPDQRTGSTISVILDAVDETDSYFSQYMPRMVEAAVIPALLLAVVGYLHWQSAAIMLFTAPFLPLFMALVGLKTKQKSEEKFAQLADFSGTFLDSLQGLVTLKLFGRERRQQKEIERSSMSFRDATMGILRMAFTNTFMLEWIVMLGIGLVALELAFQLLVWKTISFGTAFLILLLAPEFYSLLKHMGTAFHSGRTSMGAARKVEELLEGFAGAEQDEVVSRVGSKMSEMGPSRIGHSAAPPQIEMKQVEFRYGSASFGLSIGSLTIAPGEQLAIVGKSGSGKSTLLNLIAGLLTPSSGEVAVNGCPLDQYGEEAWFAEISYITQHPYVFAGTLADNIAIGARRGVTRYEIEQAAEAAELSGLISELERGCDTVIGEGGRGLSGGEKQRLALARAFLNRPSVILFDEPTVGLDLQTERILQRSIEELSRRATVLTVAHRLYTIRRADRILVLDNGKLLDCGRHEQLLVRLPLYAEMVAVQQRGGFQ